MEKIQLPNESSLSRLVFGVWRMADWDMSLTERHELVEELLSMGVSSFDHADIYGDYTCEALFGELLREAPHLRSQMELVSKCGIKLISKNRPDHNIKSYDTSYAHITLSVENSLRQLHTDHLDLLLIHRPNPLIHPEEVARAFDDLKKHGKVKNFGVSNFTPSQFDALAAHCDMPLSTNQVEISALCLDQFKNGIIDHAQQHSYPLMAWSPLAGGAVFANEIDQARRVNAVLRAWQEASGYAIDQLLFAWLLMHPARILPILGTGKIERVQKAVEALDIKLTMEQWFELWEASEGREVP